MCVLVTFLPYDKKLSGRQESLFGAYSIEGESMTAGRHGHGGELNILISKREAE